MSTMRKTFNALDTISIMTGHGSLKSKMMKQLGEFFKPQTDAQHKAVEDLADKIVQQDKNIQNTLDSRGLNRDNDAYRTAVKDVEPETIDNLNKCNEELGSPKNPQEMDKFRQDLYEFRLTTHDKEIDKIVTAEKREANDKIIKQVKGQDYDTAHLSNEEADQLALEITAKRKEEQEAVQQAKELLKEKPGATPEMTNNIGQAAEVAGDLEKAEELAEVAALVM